MCLFNKTELELSLLMKMLTDKDWKEWKVNSRVCDTSQIASFSDNKIQSTEGINHPLLEKLNLNCKFVIHALSVVVVK